jgi:hypothetical protein
LAVVQLIFQTVAQTAVLIPVPAITVSSDSTAREIPTPGINITLKPPRSVSKPPVEPPAIAPLIAPSVAGNDIEEKIYESDRQLIVEI